MGNGEFRPPGEPIETAEPIEMKLGMGDYVGDPTPHTQNEKCT